MFFFSIKLSNSDAFISFKSNIKVGRIFSNTAKNMDRGTDDYIDRSLGFVKHR